MYHPGHESAKIKRLTRSNRPIFKLDLRSTVRAMIGNLKETFPPKTGTWKKQVWQDPGYVDMVKAFCKLQNNTSNYNYFTQFNSLRVSGTLN